MKTIRSRFSSRVTRTRAILLAVFAAVLFSLRAQGQDARFYFSFDDATLRRDYMTNQAAFSRIDSLLAQLPDSLQIRSWSSPEGNFAYNLALSKRRAEAVRRYLLAACPSLQGRISIDPAAESWDELREAVLSDERLSEASRQKMLGIVDGSASADEKERLLKSLPEWKQFYRTWFRSLRFAQVSWTAPRASLQAEPSASDTLAVHVADSLAAVDTLLSAADSAAVAALAGSVIGSVADTVLAVTDSLLVASADSAVRVSGADSLVKSQADSALAAAAPAEIRAASTVGFAIRSAEVVDDFGDNGEAIAQIESVMARDTVEIAEVVLTGYASPDGSVSFNDALSLRRAEALRDRILRNYPALEGKISVQGCGEDWEGLRELVLSDRTLSQAGLEEILAIIDSDRAAQAKEASLRALSSWDYIYENTMPKLRRTRLQARIVPVPETPAEVDITIEDDIQIAISDSTRTLSDSVAVVAPISLPAEPEPTYEYIRKPLLAVSTNALYDLAITPNFAIEVPIGHAASVYAEYTFPWWVNQANNWAWEILKWDIGGRWWFSRKDRENPMDILRGHFVGLDLSAGYYDIEPYHTGYQGEFQSIALEYGYAWRLSERWRMEAFIGAGWMGTHYRYYEGTSNDQHLIYQYNGKLNWFGPTKLGVSFKYIFTHRVRVRTSGRTER